VATAQANQQYSATDLSGYKGKAIFMHVGSPLILSGDETVFLDSENFDVAAMVYKQRALVPLRAVAEHFGATVSYEPSKHEAIVSYGGKQFVFPIGKARYQSVEGNRSATVDMDTEALLKNDRTMVPIRVIAEELLKKHVDYMDGVIVISDEAIPLKGKDGLVNTVKSKIGAATKAESESQLSRVLQYRPVYGSVERSGAAVPEMGTGIARDGADQNAAEAPAAAPGEGGEPEKGAGSSDYSSTNVQVEGIDEADIVKTDGRYLYYAGSNAVRIIRADGPKLSEVSIIKLPDEKYVQEIYLDKDRLVLLGNRNEYDKIRYYPMMDKPAEPTTQGSSVRELPANIAPDAPVSDEGGAASMAEVVEPVVAEIDARIIYPGYYKSFAFADIYDISDPANPALLKSHEMEGYYQSSRKSGDHLYLITNTGWYGGIVVPLMRDTVRGKEAVPVDLKDIMVMPEPASPGYIVLSAIDITDNSKTEVEAITAYGSTIYMNESALYLASGRYDGTTDITKFRIDGMNIGYAGSGRVKGSLLNQFSMDEFEGNLRVATTDWNEGNNLFVLDGSLNVIGSVTGLAKGETIYSVRFMGDKGYIVTFRTMDPLFVFDLSDPRAPKVTGELKMPGFSNYLHPVGDGLILGIGMETRELIERDAAGNERPVGFRQGGLKISLFDVSDMGKPRELTNLVIGESGSYSEALYNHKAVMVDAASQQIVFDAYISRNKDWSDYSQGALVISYKDNKVSQKGFLKYEQPEVYGKYIPYGRRAVYIGNTLYYIQDGIINAFDYNSLEKTGSLVLK
jgi:inhibitor of cysteine peptidase